VVPAVRDIPAARQIMKEGICLLACGRGAWALIMLCVDDV